MHKVHTEPLNLKKVSANTALGAKFVAKTNNKEEFLVEVGNLGKLNLVQFN